MSNDIDEKYEILRINSIINSTVNGIFEINSLMGNSKTINSKKNHSLVAGINNINIDFDGKEIRRSRINNSRLYSITIKNGVNYQFDLKYPLNYNLYDFDAGQSILADSYSDEKIDLNDNNLSEFLEINISLDINESGVYSIKIELDDLYGEYVKKEINKFNLNQGNQIISFRINGTDIYNSKINGPYLLEYVKLSKDNVTLDSVSEPHTTNAYNYDEFERSSMPDLIIESLEVENATNVKISLANEGDSYAFAFNVNLFDDNFNSIGESLIDYLAPNDKKNISYVINTSNISKLYAIIDYDNVIEENNESNNLFIKDFEEELITFNISLTKGWNLISLPLIPNDKTASNIFKDYSKIFTYDGVWKELNNNSEIDETNGYWINSLKNQTLTIEGTEFTYPINFNLTKGWNLISYPSLNESLINKTLNNINYYVVYSYNNSLWSSFVLLRNDSLNTLNYFIPGYGYWINALNNITLTLN